MAKIEDNSDKVNAELDRRIKKALVLSALAVERTAKGIYASGQKGGPGVVTGTLRRSITHMPKQPVREVAVGTNVEYAPYLELGTSRMVARPFLRPALMDNQNIIRKLFSEAGM